MHFSDQSISIVINNFNYGRFLNQAIDSALLQTIKPYEIIVVDDGSTDGSEDILRKYEDKIIIIRQPNGGQAAAMNTGFRASTGSWIWFVDADDMLLPKSLEIVTKYLSNATDISKIHGYLNAIGPTGDSLEQRLPVKALSDGDVTKEIIATGGYCWPPTTGNIFNRRKLESIMPIPESQFRLCADLYLCTSSVFQGNVLVVPDAIASYRIHDENGFNGYKLDSTRWLSFQANNIQQVMLLTKKLVKEYKAMPDYVYPYNRRSIEMLMTVKRFSIGIKPVGLSKLQLTRQWLHAIKKDRLNLKQKLVGVVFWTILSFAPKPLTKYVIYMGIRKNNDNESH